MPQLFFSRVQKLLIKFNFWKTCRINPKLKLESCFEQSAWSIELPLSSLVFWAYHLNFDSFYHKILGDRNLAINSSTNSKLLSSSMWPERICYFLSITTRKETSHHLEGRLLIIFYFAFYILNRFVLVRLVLNGISSLIAVYKFTVLIEQKKLTHYSTNEMESFVPQKVAEAIFNQILERPENKVCADCPNKSPTWASIDFGVFVCLRCAGKFKFSISLLLEHFLIYVTLPNKPFT